MFHIIQEALANIAKHSMARRAFVAINKNPQHLEFLIEDDGLGMTEPFVSTIVTAAAGAGTVQALWPGHHARPRPAAGRQLRGRAETTAGAPGCGC